MRVKPLDNKRVESPEDDEWGLLGGMGFGLLRRDKRG